MSMFAWCACSAATQYPLTESLADSAILPLEVPELHGTSADVGWSPPNRLLSVFEITFGTQGLSAHMQHAVHAHQTLVHAIHHLHGDYLLDDRVKKCCKLGTQTVLSTTPPRL